MIIHPKLQIYRNVLYWTEAFKLGHNGDIKVSYVYNVILIILTDQLNPVQKAHLTL